MVGAIITSGFIMGILGSFHCAGMCGPLALSVPVKNDRTSERMLGALLYNLGRVVTYSIIGWFIGLIGTSFALIGIQQWLSIAAGVLILILFVFSKKITQTTSSLFPAFYEKVRNQLGILFFSKTRSSVFLIGLLNGLLPCGFVYLALAGALAAGGVVNSILFMAGFGMGTLPIMWSLVFFGQYFSLSFSRSIKKIYPYMMMMVAFLLIIRGLGLGIPYISPAFEMHQQEVHSCCHH